MQTDVVEAFGELAVAASGIGFASQPHVPVVPDRITALRNFRQALDTWPIPAMADWLTSVNPASDAQMARLASMALAALRQTAADLQIGNEVAEYMLARGRAH